MPQGTEHLEEALKLIERAAESLKPGNAEWQNAAVARLNHIATLLRATSGRFFLKTKLALPFARRCQEEALNLEALLAEMEAQPTPDALQRLSLALEALEKAARTLDERSKMQGMAIT